MVRLVIAKKMRELTDEELVRKVSGYKEELFNLRFQMATGTLDNPMRIREVRKNIARCKTVLRQREISKESNG
ncbi:MAG: ribosomal protein [Firmicutes bacterium]|jgi:large subunit ribosomal protein L29|nr:ribosomal protein [Bacillota bacterium]NLV21568.1 50S ribosomal protein L29 [Syntrophomonadaceae bacterium]